MHGTNSLKDVLDKLVFGSGYANNLYLYLLGWMAAFNFFDELRETIVRK